MAGGVLQHIVHLSLAFTSHFCRLSKLLSNLLNSQTQVYLCSVLYSHPNTTHPAPASDSSPTLVRHLSYVNHPTCLAPRILVLRRPLDMVHHNPIQLSLSGFKSQTELFQSVKYLREL